MMKILTLLFFAVLSCTEKGLFELNLLDIEGKPYSLSELKGKRFVVYVWSGTCMGHVEDLKNLSRIYSEINADVLLISIAVMMTPEDVRQVLKKNSIEPPYLMLADPKGEFAEIITLVFLPATLIIDGDGRVIANYPQLPDNLVSLILTHE